jgi:ABC-type amino acid transport substrate-binding protein
MSMSERRRFLRACVAAPLLAGGIARAGALERVRSRGSIRIALYDDFAPFSDDAGGIDVTVARALARRLGVSADIVLFDAGEDMRDDLRVMVWKGGPLGHALCDMMLHVPVDPVLAEAAPQVRIFAPYHLEQIVTLRDGEHVPPILGMDAFTRERIGVETGSLADEYLLTALGGRFRENVLHFRSLAEAVGAVRDGTVRIVVGTRAPIEAALGGPSERYAIARFTGAGLSVREWPVGVATRREDEDLGREIEAALAAMDADGSLDAAFRAHAVTRLPAS